jgi:hypothetical protein
MEMLFGKLSIIRVDPIARFHLAILGLRLRIKIKSLMGCIGFKEDMILFGFILINFN